MDVRSFVVALSIAAVSSGLPVASPTDDDAQLREATSLLVELATFPSHGGDSAGVQSAAEWLGGQFVERGFKVRQLSGGRGGDPPFVYAERAGAADAPSVLFYLHYDTQPPGPATDWPSTEGKPFQPRLLTGRFDDPASTLVAIPDLTAAVAGTARLYARGVADDKAPIIMHLKALEEWIAVTGNDRLGIRYLLDGGEESGSPGIARLLETHGALLRSDLLVLCDGPMDALGRPSIYLGARGDMHMRLKVRTAARSGHSGNYGLLPSAVWLLSDLLSSLRDARGVVAIEGLFDDVVPPTQAEKESLAEASLAEPALAAEHGVSAFDGDPAIPYYERLLFSPTLVVNHLSAGRPGNQVPHEAEAVIEVRLVTHQDPLKVFEAVKRHVEKRAPGSTLEYLDGVAASRMNSDDAAVAAGMAAIRTATGGDLLVYPTLGGTLPLLNDFSKAGHRYIGLPLVNFDNGQHVANENLRLATLPAGINLLSRLYPALATELGRLKRGKQP